MVWLTRAISDSGRGIAVPLKVHSDSFNHQCLILDYIFHQITIADGIQATKKCIEFLFAFSFATSRSLVESLTGESRSVTANVFSIQLWKPFLQNNHFFRKRCWNVFPLTCFIQSESFLMKIFICNYYVHPISLKRCTELMMRCLNKTVAYTR